VPIAAMGDYMAVLVRRPVLRDAFDDGSSSERLRRPSFGNPFRPDRVRAATLRSHTPQTPQTYPGCVWGMMRDPCSLMPACLSVCLCACLPACLSV
jgi:hypothetical protein